MTTKLIDTKDLTGAALSWAVAQAAGVDVFTCPPRCRSRGHISTLHLERIPGDPTK